MYLKADPREKQMSAEFAVKVTPEGMIPIPEPLRQELGLKPLQTVYLQTDAEHHHLVIQLTARKEIGERIVALMSEAFQGITEIEIKAGR
jgi:bifunctional DNA-binding transcriptional regulator/antitoxin component of YhaV-PrlF toxin-antitoxin module